MTYEGYYSAATSFEPATVPVAAEESRRSPDTPTDTKSG